MTAEVSHGRGGAGNITPDTTKYVDGEVVRSGIEGSHGDGAYSAGRGGAGNIGDAGTAPTVRKDGDIVPAVAVRTPVKDEDFHTGRGGAGNEHLAEGHHKNGILQHHPEDKEQEKDDAPVGLADKLKGKLFGALKK